MSSSLGREVEVGRSRTEVETYTASYAGHDEELLTQRKMGLGKDALQERAVEREEDRGGEEGGRGRKETLSSQKVSPHDFLGDSNLPSS